MDLKHLFLTYSDNEYNATNDSYYMMDSELLEAIPYDIRISNSLIFDTNRRTIYAKGMEFGGLNPVFIKVEEGNGFSGTNLVSKTAYYVTSVKQDKYGRISYSYSYAYLNLDFGTGHKNNGHGGAYMTGMYVDNNGTITYEYAEVNHTNISSLFSHEIVSGQDELHTDFYNEFNGYKVISIDNESSGTVKAIEPRYGTYVMTGAYITKDGILQTAYYDASVTSGVLNESYTVTNSKPINIITGITQSSYGQIAYTYTKLNTTHSSSGSSNNNHNLPSIINIELSADGVLTYEHVNLSGNTGTKSNATYLDLNRNEYNVIDGISQATDGKVTYTYRTIKTTHNTTSHEDTETNLGDDGLDVLTGVNIDNNGDVSYTYSHVIINQSAQAGTLTYLEGNNVTNKNTYHSYGVTWLYKDEENGNKVTFAYTDLSNKATDGIKISDITLNTTKHQIITDIRQAGDGKISYTYTELNTSHSQTPHQRTAHQNHVITNINITADGVLSYDHKALSHSGSAQGSYIINNIITDDTDSPEFIYDLKQEADGCISYKTHKIKTNIIVNSDNVGGALYEIGIDNAGQVISYAHKDLTTTSGTNDGANKKLHNDSTYKFITNISQNAYGKITYNYMTLQTSFDNLATGDSDGVITNVHIDGTGKLSYAYVNLSGNTGTRITGPSGNAGEHIPYVAGTYTYFITGISQDKHGKLTYTYAGIYSDAENNYKYHSLTIPQTSIPNTDDPSTDIVKVINGISTTNGNATSHTVSYETISVPTKKYVDELIKSNDALRYCGTVTPATSANGTFTLHHDTSGPGHTGHNNSTSTPDTDCGALYKVDGTGFFGEQRVSAGDIIISYNDSATSSSAVNWNVINENIDLRTLTATDGKNGNNGLKVVTNTWLTADGTLSYTTYSLSASNTPSNTTTSKTTQNNKSENILLNETNPKGFRVITDVNLSQTELDTKLTYTYTYLYVDQKHHGNAATYNTTSNATFNTAYTYIVTGVSLSNDGILSYSVTPYNVTDSSHAGTAVGLDTVVKVGADSGAITNLYINSTDNNKLTYVITDNSSSVEQSNGFIYKVVQNTYGKATVTGRNFSTSGHSKDSEQNYVVTYTYMGSDGQLHFDYRNLSGNTGTLKNETTITNSTKLNVITGISQAKDGKISYTYDLLNTTHTSAGNNSNNLSKVITYAWLDSNGNFTYHVTDLTTSDPTTSGTQTLLNTETQEVIASISQASDGKITAAKKTIQHGAANTSGSKISQKALTVPYDGSNGTDDFYSYKSITTNNGHITSYITSSYVLKHGAVITNTDTTEFVPAGTSIISNVEYTNGHLTKVNSTTVTDANVKFVQDQVNPIYLSGTKTAAGNDITNAYVDGITYIKNGTLYTDNSYVKAAYFGNNYIERKSIKFNDIDWAFISTADSENNWGIHLFGGITGGNDPGVHFDYLQGAIINSAISYLSTSYTHHAYFYSDIFVKAKTVDFNNTTPIDFSNLAALWGTL